VAAAVRALICPAHPIEAGDAIVVERDLFLKHPARRLNHRFPPPRAAFQNLLISPSLM
jgi:hypothetical protein